MNGLSQSVPERARKIASTIRTRLNAGETQEVLAVATGMSPATVHRLLNDHLANYCLMLAQLGLKVVPEDFRCVDQKAYDFVTSRFQHVMREAPHLIWEAQE